MRILLRIVAVLTLVSVLFTAIFVLFFGVQGGFSPLLSTGLFGVLTFLGWAITLFLGPVAFVQLWRFRSFGRVTAAVVWGSTALYYLLGLTFFRTEATLMYQTLFALSVSACLLILLILPAARRACLPPLAPASAAA